MTLTKFLLARIAEDEAQAYAMWEGDYQNGPEPGTWYQWVLAECEAKRQIVEDLGQLIDYDRDLFIVQPSVESVARRALATLAAVHADHPDYDEAWRP